MIKKKQEKQKKEKKELKEKAKKEKKVKKKVKAEKEKVKKEEEKIEKKEEKEELLFPLEEYIKAAVHLGTKAITPNMRQYVYRRKADGIAVLNTQKIDEKIALAANFLSQYEPEKIIVCCRRDSGHKALEALGNATGMRTFKKYPPGMITNTNLETFFEPEVVFIADSWLDKNVVKDAVKIHIPIVALCDTNNVTDYIDVIVPCNNKSSKSIGLVFYIIAQLYLKKKGIKKKLDPIEFYEFEDEEKIKKKEKQEKIDKIKELIAKKIRIKKQY